ncbi:MAG: hypothetical protein ACTSXH_17520 [Promethearchaeota archaeon]
MTIVQESKILIKDEAKEENWFITNKFFKPAELYIFDEKIAW